MSAARAFRIDCRKRNGVDQRAGVEQRQAQPKPARTAPSSTTRPSRMTTTRWQIERSDGQVHD